MKISCPREELLAAVQTVGCAVSKRLVLPVLTHILFRVENGSVSLAATDLEISLSCKVEAAESAGEDGAFTVPATTLEEILKALPDADVTLETQENYMVMLKCGKSRFKMYGFNPEEVPMTPEIEELSTFTIESMTLKNAVKRVLHTVLSEESAGIYNGAYLTCSEDDDENVCRLVSTDRKRLTVQKCQIANLQGKLDVILPHRALDELKRVVCEDDDIEVAICSNQIRFVNTKRQIVFVSRLLDGTYTAYERLIPAEHNKSFSTTVAGLAECIKRVAIIAKRDSVHKLVIKLEENRLALSSVNEALGEVYEELEVQHEGDDIEMAFNCNFWVNVLEALEDCEEIDFKLTGVLKPVLVSATSDSDYLCVLMPMEVNG